MATQNVTNNESPTIFIVDTDQCSQHLLDEHADILDQQVWLRTERLENVIAELESNQQQMVQQEKMAMINQLTAGIAHEINNPLGFISSNVASLGKFCERLLMFAGAQHEMLISGKPDSIQGEQLQTVRDQLKIERIIRDIPEMIRETMEGVDRIKRIIIDLKRLSSVDDSELKLADINQCLESTLNIAIVEMRHNTKVKREYGELPRLLCYPQQLNQVFIHLLDNAVHAIDTQGMITVRSWNAQGRIYVSFSDNGHGIPEHQLSRIFEPFFTTKEAGRGTGLGLSINNEIIRNHGGEIKVDSEVGQGSTFTVSIPLERGSTTSVQQFQNRLSIIDYEKSKTQLTQEITKLRKYCDTLEITERERKQLESEVQDAREYAENIVETVREPLVVLNSDLKILTANHSFYDTFKVKAEETIGNFIYDLGNRQWDIPKLRILIEEILPHDTAFNGYEVEHDFPGIGRKIILLNAREIFREKIGSHIILLAMEDITERKQLESEIQDAREYAENIVETVRKPLVVLNSDLKILTANHSFYDTFKVTPEETIGNFIYDLGNRQWDIPKLRVLFEDILPHNTVFNGYEVEHDFVDIGHKIILLNARQIFRENIGSHIILLAMEDITDRRRSEEALRESEERFSGMFRKHSAVMLLIEPETGVIIDANLAAERFFEYSHEILLNMNIVDINALSPDAMLIGSYAALTEDRNGVIFPIKTACGDVRMVEVHSTPITVLGTTRLFSIIHDITERKLAENALVEANLNLEAQSITDGLTGIANRRHFDEVLAHEYSRHSRSGAELSLILLDIDYFKLFNDSYGHVNGDECLRQIAQVITNCAARSADLAARYGGEEFACILPDTNIDGAIVIAEKIRLGIIALAIPHKGSSISQYVTASMGVVSVRCTVERSTVDIVAQVDDLLYQAKSHGRNRVEFISARGNSNIHAIKCHL